MPKRSNPFTDDPNQLKSHIGQMEVANGVAGKTILQKIHENTMKRLLDGAKSFYSGCVLDAGDCEPGENNNGDRSKKSGTVESSGMKAHKNSSICHTCKDPNIAVRCSFCEFSSCISCMRTCSKCEQDFCSLCAVVSYESSSECAFCLNCSSRR